MFPRCVSDIQGVVYSAIGGSRSEGPFLGEAKSRICITN